MVLKGSFPALMLAPVNFDAIYQLALERKKAESAEAQEPALSGPGQP